jgi:hypothetical protein
VKNVLKFVITTAFIAITFQQATAFSRKPVTDEDLGAVTDQFHTLVSKSQKAIAANQAHDRAQVNALKKELTTLAYDIVNTLAHLNSYDLIKQLLQTWITDAQRAAADAKGAQYFRKENHFNGYKLALWLINEQLVVARSTNPFAQGLIGGTGWAQEGFPKIMQWFHRSLVQKGLYPRTKTAGI